MNWTCELTDQDERISVKNMRKRLKRKRRSCRLCKPHKMGMSNRWTPKELSVLKETEREIRLMPLLDRF
jgi:hypothetical protein